MGFRNNCWATVWRVDKVSDVNTKAQISVSKKNKESGEYETDFSGIVNFIGRDCAQKALKLGERARIRLESVDVSNRYDKEKKITYHNFKVFAFLSGDEEKPTQTESTPAESSGSDEPW